MDLKNPKEIQHKPFAFRFPLHGSKWSINQRENKPSHLQQIQTWGRRFEATTNSMFDDTNGTNVPINPRDLEI